MQKFKLLRDGQIVGYKRTEGENVWWSYDNQTWSTAEIPFDVAKTFLNFDQTNLVEVYEA